MKYALPLMAFIFSSQLNAQNFSRDYGNITQDELVLAQYDLDKDADAVVLYDIGKSRYDETNMGSLNLVFERKTKIKIFTEAGIDHATIEIPLYQEKGGSEKLRNLEAFTYNYSNGKLVKSKLNQADVHEEKYGENFIVKKFTFPEVKPGSVIEYKYELSSPYLGNLQDWEFQSTIPVVHSEYEARLIPFYQYTWLQQGTDKFDYHISYKDKAAERTYAGVDFSDMVHKFIMRDVPAFKDEAFITSINDYIIKLDFQLAKVYYPKTTVTEIPKGMNNPGQARGIVRQEADSSTYITTWPEMVKELYNDEDFGNYVRKSEKLVKDLFGTSLDGKTPREKFDMIITYVKKNINWDKMRGVYASKNPGALIKDKFGSVADINLFATGLLNGAGIEAYPVIISTRDHGKIAFDYPYLSFFNYVIIGAYFDGNIILSDCTEPLIPNNRIPSRCFNDKGLMINGKKVEWLDFQCSFTSEKVANIAISVVDSRANAKIRTHTTEYDALSYRKAFETDVEKVKKSLIEEGYEVVDSSIIIKNHTNITDPYILTYVVKDDIEQVNNKLYISPFLKESISQNPLTQPTRTYPIDMIYPEKRTFNSWITIPEGYKVDYVAENQSIKNDLFEMNYSATTDEKKVTIIFNYNFKHSVYPPEVYDQVRSFFNELVKKVNEKVVFAKSE